MDEADHAMQAELASQAGSIAHSDKMELEQEDHQIVRDAEMEIHDMEAEGTIDEMQAAIADDAEMNAEIQEHEQEHIQAEGDWKDIDAEVDVLPPGEGAPADVDDSIIPVQVEDPESSDVQPFEQLEDATSAGNGITDNTTASPQATAQAEAEQQTLAQDLGLADAIDYALPEEHIARPSDLEASGSQEQQPKAKMTVSSKEAVLDAEGTEVPAGGESNVNADEAPEYDYADAYEPVASTSAIAVEDYSAPLTAAGGGYRRPALQKEYLAHVEIFSGPPPLLENGSSDRAAPHVSLLHDNNSFSLFRPSSVPSGDNEGVIFGADKDQYLYYSSLDVLIGKLHEAFPQFRGDGDNELILDFGILDMQISEDNVYTQQLSLHDFDKIRVGMSQPELDRLQISLVVGKRFVYKFNELAEHVYRMHAGSEYDSGTVYDETVEEDGGTDEIPEYYDEGAAEEDAYGTAEEAHAIVTGDDLVHGVEAENDVDEVNTAPTDALGGPEEEPIEYPEDEAEGGGRAELPPSLQTAAQEDADPSGLGQELHPPSDEYYEDPEFSQHPADQEEEEAYEEQYNDQEEEEAEGDSETVQDYTEEDAETDLGPAAEAEAELTIDPDAPLDEVTEQIEGFEEGTLQGEEDVAAESRAARDAEPTIASTSVNVEAVDKDTERIYAGMDSLAAEDQGHVDASAEPTSAIAPDLPVAKLNDTGKRGREEEDENAQPSVPNGVGAAVAQLDDGVKRPRVSLDA